MVDGRGGTGQYRVGSQDVEPGMVRYWSKHGAAVEYNCERPEARSIMHVGLHRFGSGCARPRMRIEGFLSRSEASSRMATDASPRRPAAWSTGRLTGSLGPLPAAS